MELLQLVTSNGMAVRVTRRVGRHASPVLLKYATPAASQVTATRVLHPSDCSSAASTPSGLYVAATPEMPGSRPVQTFMPRHLPG